MLRISDEILERKYIISLLITYSKANYFSMSGHVDRLMQRIRGNIGILQKNSVLA
jgi:hypothetical protein